MAQAVLPARHNAAMETFTGWHTWAGAAPALRRLLPAETVADLARAVDFATAHHGDQRRKTGAPYLEHLLEAVQILVEGAGVTSRDVLVAAVLHDVVEDTPCTLPDVSDAFGPRVAGTVKENYLRGLAAAPADAVLVKLADRASNVQTLRNLSPDGQRAYYAQTVTHVVPLAAAQPWFAAWYAGWQSEFADLAEGGQPATPG
jgi:guanosine-3',5'-bis(diphosphate) 3'-pyrophosphohydrolase